MKREELRQEFERACEIKWENSRGEPDIDYVMWLEDKITATQPSLPPAEGAEQRIRVRNILQDFYRRGEYELEQAEEDIMRLFQPQPPAEGAVPDNAAEQNKRMREWFKERTGLDDTLLSIHMKQIDVMLKGVQPQPTAEGAEEILRKNCNTCYSRSTGEEEVWSSVSSVLIAMQDFATLHAQRIADKMVEERLRITANDLKRIKNRKI